jgi:hypothetical protein
VSDTPTQFDYLLNAFEAASQSKAPAEAGYAAKRQALFDYVRGLEAQVVTTRAERNEAWYGDEARRHGHYSRNRDEANGGID